MNIIFSKFKKREFILLLIFVLIGIFLRFGGVLTNSFAFTYDVGRDMIALYDIVVNHKITLIGATTGLPGVFYGPFWYLFLLPFFIIFRGDPQGIAFIMASIGTILIPLAYLIGKKMGSEPIGLIFAGLISVSPVLISLSSQIWNPNIAPLFVLFLLLSLLQIFRSNKKNNLSYFFLGLLLSVSLDLEIVFGLFLTIGTILSILIINKKIILKQIIFFVLGYTLILLPRIIFELRHQFIMTKSFITFITSGNDNNNILSFSSLFYSRIKFIFDNFSQTIALGNNMLAAIFIVLVLVGIFLNYKNANNLIKKITLTSFIILSSFIVGLTFFGHDLWPHYIVGLPIVYLFLFSVSLFLIHENFGRKWIIILFIFGIIISNFNPISQIQSFSKPVWVGNASVYRNQLEAIDYVYSQASGKDFKFIVYTPPLFDYTYRYLFPWYGMKKYNYLPTKSTKDATFSFFIIEPDPGYEDRPKLWLKNRENNGKIIKSQKLSSGIVIQTRIH